MDLNFGFTSVGTQCLKNTARNIHSTHWYLAESTKHTGKYKVQ